ncbi:hypothetical protein Dimus_029035 [Dionaea muscipula]
MASPQMKRQRNLVKETPVATGSEAAAVDKGKEVTTAMVESQPAKEGRKTRAFNKAAEYERKAEETTDMLKKKDSVIASLLDVGP